MLKNDQIEEEIGAKIRAVETCLVKCSDQLQRMYYLGLLSGYQQTLQVIRVRTSPLDYVLYTLGKVVG